MNFFKYKRLSRKRISSAVDIDLVQMHRNVSANMLSKGKFESFLGTLKVADLDKYPEIDGLIKTIADHHHLNIGNIMVTSGIDGALKAIFEMCTSEGDAVVTYEPTYAMYKVYSDAYGIELRSIILDPMKMFVTCDQVCSAVSGNISILFLPNPNLPIEICFNREEIEKILKYSNERDVLVVVDEAYYGFGSDTAISLIKKYDNLLVARTFSKAYGLPGIRLGYLVGSEDLIDYLQTRRFAHESNALSVAAGIWAIRNYDSTLISDICESREWFMGELKSIGIRD